MAITTGNCCPGEDGKYNPCCSFCKQKTACKSFAQTATTMCCPARTGVKNECCTQ